MDIDPEVVNAVIRYCYYVDYTDETEHGMAALLLNMQVYSAADRYMIEPLQNLAPEKFNKRAHEDWNTDVFADMMRQVYDPKVEIGKVGTLKATVLEVTKKHANDLFHGPYASFQSAVLSSPEFMFEYLKSMTAKPALLTAPTMGRDMIWYQCPGQHCQNHGAVFGVASTVPRLFGFDCPLNCRAGSSQVFWSSHKIGG